MANMEKPIEEMSEEELIRQNHVVLYHGTSLDCIDEILADGVLPWNQLLGGHNWRSKYDAFGFFEPKMDSVYLAARKRAEDYARYRAEGKIRKDKWAVVEVGVDTNLLSFDEDSFRRTWYESFAATKTCCHEGKIPPQLIIQVFDSHGECIYDRVAQSCRKSA
jgi:hypothetical protein